MNIRSVTAANPSAMTLDGTRTHILGNKRVLIIDHGPKDKKHLKAVFGVVGATPVNAILLTHTHPRGVLARAHAEVAEALGGLAPHPATIRALGAMLSGGDWWAPLRTATLRRAAAAALDRLGTADAFAMLELAASHGPRGARRVARSYLPRRSVQP